MKQIKNIILKFPQIYLYYKKLTYIFLAFSSGTKEKNIFQEASTTEYDRHPDLFNFLKSRYSDKQIKILSFGCSSGEVISISGRRSSSAIVLPSEEVEVGSIHLEATTRLNVCSRVGDGVSVSTRKKVPTLNRVVFAPVRKVVEMSNLQDLVGPNLNGRFIGKGDHITFPSPNGGVLELQAEKVGGIFSIGSGGLIGPETDVEVLGRDEGEDPHPSRQLPPVLLVVGGSPLLSRCALAKPP